jgi:hypothetical protein
MRLKMPNIDPASVFLMLIALGLFLKIVFTREPGSSRCSKKIIWKDGVPYIRADNVNTRARPRTRRRRE